jgi:hypothetical protein
MIFVTRGTGPHWFFLRALRARGSAVRAAQLQPSSPSGGGAWNGWPATYSIHRAVRAAIAPEVTHVFQLRWVEPAALQDEDLLRK